MSLSDAIIAVLVAFQPVFTQPTWQKALALVVGTLRARGQRTVTAALRQMGYAQCVGFSRFHHVLNRAHWSCLALSQRLLAVLVARFSAPGDRLTIVIDEHLERRWGRRISKRGHYRDPLASSNGQSVSTSGLRGVVVALVVQPPWTTRSWALPFLSILATPPEVSVQLGRHHKTTGDWAGQVVRLLRRWLPAGPIEVVGDRAYSSLALGVRCHAEQVTLITPLRLDANLFAPPPPRPPRQTGRPRVKGVQLPKLERVLTDPQTRWQTAALAWSSGGPRKVAWCSATARWYHSGQRPLAIRWGLVRDPSGKHDPTAYLCTNEARPPLEIVRAYMKRWPRAVTLEESRAPLGVETQRQWSDQAIERSTPVVLGLYSLVTLLGQALTHEGQVPVQQTAWYHKEQATFSDVLAVVRRELWGNFRFCTSPDNPDLLLIPRAVLEQLAFAVGY